MTVQAILLGLGTVLLAVAGVVFTAVNWSRLDASAQGVVLLVLTAALALATGRAARRGLPATAEALGLVTVVLTLVDLHAARVSFLPDSAVAAYWAAGLSAVAVLAWVLAGVTGIRSTAILAVIVGQAPALLALLAADAPAAPAAAVLLLQVAVVLVWTGPLPGARAVSDRAVGVAALVPAACTWVVVTGGTALWLAIDGPRSNAELVVVVVLAAVVAVLAAICASGEGARSMALASATGSALAACGWAAALVMAPSPAWASIGVAAALVVGVGLRAPARWGGAPAGTAAVVAGIVLLDILGPISSVFDRLDLVTADVWRLDASDRAVPGLEAHAGPATALHLVALGTLVWAVRSVLGRRVATWAGAGFVSSAVLLAPVLVPLTIGGASAVSWLVALGVLAVAEVRLRDPERDRLEDRGALRAAAGLAGALLALAGFWAAAASGPSVVVGVVVVVAAGAVLARSLQTHDDVLANLVMGVVVIGVAAEAAMVALLAGTAAVTAVACAGAAALLASTIAVLALPSRVAPAAEVAAWYVHALTLMVLLAERGGGGGGGSAGVDAAWRTALLSGVIAASVRTFARRSAPFAALAAAQGLTLWWIELAASGVAAPEPYTLPTALVLALAGGYASRNVDASEPRPGSWVTDGSALLVVAVPTVWLSLVRPHGPRPLVALAVAMVVLAVGAFSGRRAMVDVGAGAVAVLAAARLAPVLAEAPNWLTIGLTGAVLVAVGATFEERRRDARGVRDRYSALR